jgi:hypothetical protein
MNIPLSGVGMKNNLSSVPHPGRTLLVTEGSAPAPWSWHGPSPYLLFHNAQLCPVLACAKAELPQNGRP